MEHFSKKPPDWESHQLIERKTEVLVSWRVVPAISRPNSLGHIGSLRDCGSSFTMSMTCLQGELRITRGLALFRYMKPCTEWDQQPISISAESYSPTIAQRKS